MTRLPRALRSRPGEDGFTMVELMAAMGVMLVAVVAMLFTTMAGFRGIAAARRRQAANGLANQTVEQVRALPFDTLKLGLSNSDLAATSDTRIDKSGAPSVYKYGGEQIPHGGNANVVPLVPHQQSVTKGNVTYTVSAYVTYYQNQQTSNTYRLTVVVTWPTLAGGGSSSMQAQTILYSPTGCFSTATHPFSAPCQAFLYGNASNAAGQIAITGTIQGIGLDHAAVWLPGQTSGVQVEQVQAVQGTAQTSGVELQQTGDADEQTAGRQQATSGSDNDPSQPKPDYQLASAGAQSSSTLTASGSNNSIWVTSAAGDTASTMSTVAATTASHPCPLLVPSSSYDMAQNDSQPCGSAKVQQGGSASAHLGLQAGATQLGDTVLAQVDAPVSPTTAITHRDIAPETTICKFTSADGCVQSQQTRTWGTVTLAKLPPSLPGSDVPTGYVATKGLIQLTGLSDSVTAEAGIGTAAPAATISGGTVSYYNGSGYSTLTVAASPAAIPLGTGGNGVHITDNAFGGATLQLDVTANLATGGTSTSDSAPSSCPSPCTRTQASATSNSPITGTITYQVTYGGTTLANLTMTVDLGTLLAKSSYTGAPSGA